jgi:hypothetical protein
MSFKVIWIVFVLTGMTLKEIRTMFSTKMAKLIKYSKS